MKVKVKKVKKNPAPVMTKQLKINQLEQIMILLQLI